jgi:hypothetical protein
VVTFQPFARSLNKLSLNTLPSALSTLVFVALVVTLNTQQAHAQTAWQDTHGNLYLDTHARAFFGDQDGQPFVDTEGYVFVTDEAGTRYYLHPDQSVHHHVWDTNGNAIAVFRDVQRYHINVTSGGNQYFTTPTGDLYTTSSDTHFLLNEQGMPYREGGKYYVLDELGRRFFLDEDGLPYQDASGQYLVDKQGNNHYLVGNP